MRSFIGARGRIHACAARGEPRRRIATLGFAVQALLEEASPKLKKPPLFQVVLLNDDYTPMEFVVDVLQRIFGMDRQGDAGHAGGAHEGQGRLRRVYVRDRRDQGGAGDGLRPQHQHPLLCTMEEA
jgi:ATP-dependent Clp protease adaptor protein ClpS